jgi:hypothetical protein
MQRVIAHTEQRERLTDSNGLVLGNENAADIAPHLGRNNYRMRLNGGAIGALQNSASGLIIQIPPQASRTAATAAMRNPAWTFLERVSRAFSLRILRSVHCF